MGPGRPASRIRNVLLCSGAARVPRAPRERRLSPQPIARLRHWQSSTRQRMRRGRETLGEQSCTRST